MALGAGLVGCVDFTGPGIDANPNVPSAANARQLFPAIQAFQQASVIGDAARYVSTWTQQMMGINRQWSSYARYGSVDENLLDWSQYYTGGGLIDLRLIQASSNAAGDKQFLGIAQVYEALILDAAADYWGNIVYKRNGVLQAVQASIPTPGLERQDSVYADLQILLDSAIVNMAGAGPGPGLSDLVFNGNTARWIPVAHTIKARIALHQRNYTLAASEAALGISSKAGDYNTYQSATTGEENGWFQFRRNRGTDMSAGDSLVTMMQSRTDPRLAAYFGVNGSGAYKGAKPGDEDDGTFSWLSTARGDPAFRQPWVTYDETQLIKAEALSRNGNDAGALAALQAYKTANGITFNFAAPATGAALRQEIMNEKYIALFQNPESWSDYKRTCTPNVRANPTATAPNTKIPMRFFYYVNERQTNPNIPVPSAQPVRNFVDAGAAPVPYSGGTCLAQP
jgi:hypothetical protein